jgi:integrase
MDMKGVRPFTDEEITAIKASFCGRYAARDRALFVVGLRTGFRISELLSLRKKDIYAHGKVLDRVSVERKHMKKKTQGRTVLLHPEARAALSVWLEQMGKLFGTVTEDTPLFCSRVKGSNGQLRPIARETAWRILKHVCVANELSGRVGCHSWRKAFASKMYEALHKDLVKVQRTLGHLNINSTVAYLASFRNAEIDAAIITAA